MRHEAYQMIHNSEATWWYDARIYTVKRLLEKLSGASTPERICDIGAGFGAQVSALSPFGTVTAFEPDVSSRAVCKTRGYTEVYDGDSFEAFAEKRKGHYTLVTLFDVLEHIEKERPFLDHTFSLLAPGGHLLITVPAFQSLWSEHDVVALHYRRYRLPELQQRLRESGFIIRYSTYWNMLLFLPAAIMRLTGHSGQSSLSMPRLLDRLFYYVIIVETFLMPYLSLPFGTSVCIYAEKPLEKSALPKSERK